MIKALIFDMDGTLVNTGEIGFEIFEDTLKENKLDYTKEEVMSIANRSFTDVLKEIFSKNSKSYQPEVRNNMIKKYTEKIKQAKLLPHAKELLETVHDKAIMILATFSLKKQVEIIVKNNDLKKYFDKIVTADTKPYKEKKNQINDIISELKLKPEECIHIEDTHYGIKSGQHNGVFTIGVRHYFDDLKADINVDNLDQVKETILEKLKNANN